MYERIVTAVVPHIPPRADVLPNAIKSIAEQTHKVSAINVVVDINREGSARTRTRGVMSAVTTWVAFLDDDDTWYPHHVETLLNHALTTGADVVYSYCVVLNEQGHKVWDPFGQPFDAKLLYERPYITSVSLVRTDLAKQAQFMDKSSDNAWGDDEWGFYQRLHTNGAKFSYVPEITWVWNHNRRNTNGKTHNW